VKLAVVVQRYGADISGGAELHARIHRERLARHAQVEVLTTRARDYVTWRNELPRCENHQWRHGAALPRHEARHASTLRIRRTGSSSSTPTAASSCVAGREGPESPALIGTSPRRREFDFFCFQFSVLPRLSRRGVPRRKAVLVPTAERDPRWPRDLRAVFRSARAVMYTRLKSACS
jgi:hypothetical protein